MLNNRLGSCSLVTIATGKSGTKGLLDLGNAGIPLPHALCRKSASSPSRCSWGQNETVCQFLSSTNLAIRKEASRLCMHCKKKKNPKNPSYPLFWLDTRPSKNSKEDYLPTAPLPLPLPLRPRSAPLPATPVLPPSKPFSWPRTWVMKREQMASYFDTIAHAKTADN